MPAPVFNQTTASAASGDINISITPQAANNLEIVCTSAWQTSSNPAGWTLEQAAFRWRVAPSTSPLTFDTTNPNPGPAWTALMLDLPTISTPAREQAMNIDFGSFPSFHPYSHTFTGGNQLNDGDAIIWNMGSVNTAPGLTGLNVSDSQGNTYNIFQFTQIIGGLYYTSLLAIAFGAKAGVCTTNFDITAPGTTLNQSFGLNLFTFSGLVVPPPPVPPISQVVLNFQDPSGAPLANGSVQLRLTQDASAQFAGGPQIAAGRVVTVQLDSTGTGIANIRPTEGLLPSVTYQAQAFTAQGQPVWRGNLTIGLNQPSYILLEDGTLIYLETGGGSAILTES